MDNYIPEKVLKYEAFINDVLKEELRKIAQSLDQAYSEIADFVQLENMIQTIQENNLVDEGLKTKVDIGCNFYMQAFVPDPLKILVDVGLGYFVEFTLSEALLVIKRRVDVLNKKVDILRDQSANTKAHIKLVLNGIQELQKLKANIYHYHFGDQLIPAHLSDFITLCSLLSASAPQSHNKWLDSQ